jgi:hypothetical protein
MSGFTYLNYQGSLEGAIIEMKISAKLMRLAIVFIALNITTVLGFNIKLIKKTKLSQENTLLGNPWSFCVTEDDLFLIPDYKAGNVKIYDGNGNLLTVFGSKGYGPGEFVNPTFCFYNKADTKFGVMDHRMRKIFVYKRTGKTDFTRVHELFCLAAGNAIQLQGNKLLVSGYKTSPNNKPYDLYYVDLTNNQNTFLLPSYYKYGLKSPEEFKTKYIIKREIPAIGIRGWFDILGDDVYFIWEGDLSVIKINIKSGKLSSFGEKVPNYVKPFTSKKLLDGLRNRDINIIRNEKAEMSFVRNIFASPNYILVIYEGPVKQDNESNFRLQFYTINGHFLEEIQIPGKTDRRMYFDKEKDILYSLFNEAEDDLHEGYFILGYKIVK